MRADKFLPIKNSKSTLPKIMVGVFRGCRGEVGGGGGMDDLFNGR